MATEHVDIPDGERHEPKGADSATVGDVYVSDGANSGAWSKLAAAYASIADSAGWFTATTVEAALGEIMAGMPGGWGYYKDNASGQTVNTAATKLSIDGLDASTDESHLPLVIRGSGNLWDTTGDKIDAISEDDVYQIRLDLPITATTGSPSHMTVEVDVSAGATPASVIAEHELDVSKAAPFNLTYSVPLLVNSNFITNNAQIFLTANTGTVTVTAPAITIVRIHNGNM